MERRHYKLLRYKHLLFRGSNEYFLEDILIPKQSLLFIRSRISFLISPYYIGTFRSTGPSFNSILRQVCILNDEIINLLMERKICFTRH